MLRITESLSASAAKDYFDHALRLADYYEGGQETAGLWHGQGAARLGLMGRVTREAFFDLIDNKHPLTGERLTPRTKANRRAGIDFTFNAPKSVSLLFAVTGDDRIMESHRRAVADTMREIEADMKTRVRVNGKNEDRITGNLVWAEFLHHTTRPVDGVPDPHMHTHAYVPNLTYDLVEARWKAAQTGDLHADRQHFEAAYLSRLARHMTDLGYGIARDGKYWDVAGLPRSLIEQFSRRTMEIEAAAKEKGITRPDEKAELGAKTRKHKSEDVSMSELRDIWLSRIGPRDRKLLDQVVHNAKHGVSPESEAITARAAVSYAMDHHFARSSVIAERQLRSTALYRSYGVVSPEEANAAIRDTDQLIGRAIAGRRLVSTGEILREERRMLQFARTGQMSCRALGPSDYRIRAEFLNEQQRAAIRHILASGDRIVALRGGAGTGKTTLMHEAIAGIAEGGKHTFVFAPTSEAARDTLRKEGFIGAETVQRLLLDTKLQDKMQGAVIWIDEAGLLSVPDMARLFEIAKTQEARVVLCGDTRQHQSVSRGDAMRLLENNGAIRPAEVREIVRQRGAYKDAVSSIAKGNVGKGFKQLEAMGSVHEIGGERRMQKIASDYVALAKHKKSVIVVSPTHAEKDAVTKAIRSGLVHAKLMGDEQQDVTTLRNLQWTDAEKEDPARYQSGMVIKFHKFAPSIKRGARFIVDEIGKDGSITIVDASDRRYSLPLSLTDRFNVYEPIVKPLRVGERIRIMDSGVTYDGAHRLHNGSFYQVGGFAPTGDIELTNGWIISRNYGHLDYGYTTTSVSSQGKTVDVVLLAMGRESRPATFHEQFYVSASRGRQAIRVYTDDIEATRKAIAVSAARGSATELISGDIDRKAKPLAREAKLDAHIRSMMQQAAWRSIREVDSSHVSAELMRTARRVVEIDRQGRVVAEHAPELGQ